MNKELLPCPFCGNEAEFKPYKRDGLTLKCKSLGCVSSSQRTLRYDIDWLQGKMVERWNTRATLSALQTNIAQPIQPANAIDAIRYRWLRMQDWFDGELCVLREPKKVLTRGNGLGADCPSRERLDQAIDAAIARQIVGASQPVAIETRP